MHKYFLILFSLLLTGCASSKYVAKQSIGNYDLKEKNKIGVIYFDTNLRDVDTQGVEMISMNSLLIGEALRNRELAIEKDALVKEQTLELLKKKLRISGIGYYENTNVKSRLLRVGVSHGIMNDFIKNKNFNIGLGVYTHSHVVEEFAIIETKWLLYDKNKATVGEYLTKTQEKIKRYSEIEYPYKEEDVNNKKLGQRGTKRKKYKDGYQARRRAYVYERVMEFQAKNVDEFVKLLNQ